LIVWNGICGFWKNNYLLLETNFTTYYFITYYFKTIHFK
jgi:hypothetical protein